LVEGDLFNANDVEKFVAGDMSKVDLDKASTGNLLLIQIPR
jgi:hypothetical protein